MFDRIFQEHLISTVVRCHMILAVVLQFIDEGVLSGAQAARGFYYGIEHRLQVER
jgi:hypothetical protein